MKTYQSRLNVKKSLRLSVMDGAAFAAMMGFTQSYITPFALAFKATTAQIGLLTSIPNITMAISQLAAPNLLKSAGSRKGLILPMVFMHAFMWLPVLLLPYVYSSGEVWWLIAFITVGTVFGSFANPAWGSMMADLVPEEFRGRYFSFRGRIAGIITLVFTLIAGVILHFFTNNVFTGFTIIFSGALVFRMLSAFFLSRMYEPPLPREKENEPGIFDIFKNLGTSNLGKFTLFIALIMFAQSISGPFFAVFMIRDCNFSYVSYMVVISASAVATFIFQPFWGRRADKAGNIKVIKMTAILLPFVPLVWLGSYNVFYLVAANIFSGFAWSGFNLAAVNFVYDASEPAARTKQIAVFNSITGLALCLGSLIGGYIAPHLPALFGFELRTLFTISGALRGVVVIFLLRTIFEVRHVPKIDSMKLLLGRSVSKRKTRRNKDEHIQ
jgi:MFS family permease